MSAAINRFEAGNISVAKRLWRRSSGLKAWLATALAVAGFCFWSQATTHQVSIQDSTYVPNELAITVGDTVTWTQNDVTTEHTVTSDDDLFNSDTMFYGDTFSLIFNGEGTYTYFCIFHGHGMAGSVVVAPAGPNNPPNTPVNLLPVNNATNQPVAVQLRGSIFSDPDAIDFHAASQWVLRYASNGLTAVDSGEVTGGSLTNYSPAGLSEGTGYDWQVRYKDGRGMWSAYSTSTRFTTLIPFAQPGIGLRASYNNVIDFVSPLAVVTNATVDFHWGKARPNRRITADDFAVRWEGSLLPQFTQQYQIQFCYRGRSRVWVNNQLIIDEWTGCSFVQTRRGSVALVAGQLAAVRVEYAADPAGAQAILSWTSPGLPMEVIPSTRLFPYGP